MKPVDYETFMAEKEEHESISVDKPVEQPLPPLPPKQKRAFGTPILIGAIVFLLLISFIGVYYSFSAFFEGGFSGQKAEQVAKGSFQPVFVDSDFSVYNAKVDSWTPKKDGTIPFGSWVLTGSDSRRNIFTINKEHTIRTDVETKFKIDEAKPTDNFKTKVSMDVEDGVVWIEGAGDVFEVKTPRGVAKGNGNNFQLIVKDKSVKLIAWKGDLTFVPDKDPEKPVKIGEGKLLFIDSMDNMIPPPPNLLSYDEEKSDWQIWNLALKSEDLVGEKPSVAEIIKVEEKKELKEPVAVEEPKAPEVATDKKPGEPDTAAPGVVLDKPVEETPKMDLPKIETGPKAPKFGDPKYPTKVKPAKRKPIGGKKVEEPRHPGDGKQPPEVPQDLLDKPQAPPPDKPVHDASVHKVHTGGTSGPGQPGDVPSDLKPAAKAGDDVLDAPIQDKGVLNNPNTKGKTLPPGMGIHGEPKGPSEQ